MPRLRSDRSRPYPGRPARPAVQLPLESVMHGNMSDDRAGVSRGHSSSPSANEGPNPEQGEGPANSTSAMNPSGGAVGRRVVGIPRKLTTGCAAGCACAIGSNGVTAAPRFVS